MKISVPSCFTMSVDDRRWFVLRVRAGMEGTIFDELAAKGYDVYVPRRRYDQNNRRNRVWVSRNVPLMPGYLFLVHPRKDRIADDWTEVSAINGVSGPLAGAEGPLRVPASVIELVMSDEFGSVYDETAAGKRARGEGERHRLEERFAPGRQFLVKDGPFASFMAEVDSVTHDDKVKALVAIFGRMTVVEFETDQLEESPKRTKAART